MSLMEVLGNYFDTHEVKNDDAMPEYNYNFNIFRRYKGTNMFQTSYDLLFENKETKKMIEVDNSYYSFDSMLLKIHPNGDERVCSDISTVLSNNNVSKGFQDKIPNFAEVLLDTFGKNSLLLTTSDVLLGTLELKLAVNKDKLKEKSASSRNGKSAKDFFAQVCSAKCKGDITSGRGWRAIQAFESNSIKSTLVGMDSYTLAFIIEYLYGTKVAKSATRKDKLISLAKIPYTDFGLQDVQDLHQLTKSLDSRYLTVSEMYIRLSQTKVKPKTDLARWFKSGDIKQESSNANL